MCTKSAHLALAPLIPLCLERFTHYVCVVFADFACHSYQLEMFLYLVSCGLGDNNPTTVVCQGLRRGRFGLQLCSNIDFGVD